MVIYDEVGEVRVTADHRSVATIEGRVVIEMHAGRTHSRFVPSKPRLRVKGWRWDSSEKVERFVRAAVYSGGDRLFDLGGESGGWWVPRQGNFTLTF